MHTHVHLLMCTACAWHAQVLAQGLTLSQVTNSIADLIADRSAAGMDYGVVLVPHRATTPSAQLPVLAFGAQCIPQIAALCVLQVPEGLVEFIPEMGKLMHELNEILAHGDANDDSNSYLGMTEDAIEERLTAGSAAVFGLLPEAIRSQLLLDRDPHGNVQVRGPRPGRRSCACAHGCARPRARARMRVRSRAHVRVRRLERLRWLRSSRSVCWASSSSRSSRRGPRRAAGTAASSRCSSITLGGSTRPSRPQCPDQIRVRPVLRAPLRPLHRM